MGELVPHPIRRAFGAVAVSAVVVALAALPATGRAVSLPAAKPAAAATAPVVSISAVGDTILGYTPHLPSEPRRYFRDVRRAITANEQIVFANLEGTLTTQTQSKCSPSSSNCYAFR